MKKTYSILSEFILTPVLTIATVSQLSSTQEGRLMIGIAAAVMLIYSAYMLWKKWEEEMLRYRSFVLIGCAFIGIVFCFVGSSREKAALKYDARRNQFMSEMRQGYLDQKKREQEMDGYRLIAQAEKYYKDEYYKEAREYAQRAANERIPDGYIMLAKLDILGIGGPVDEHQAVTNTIKAMKYGFVAPKEETAKLFRGSISLSDSLEIEECRKQQAFVLAIKKHAIEAYNKSGKGEALKIIRENGKELSSLAVSGFAPAAELMFLNAYYSKPIDFAGLKLYSEMLYRAASLSTNPAVRADQLKAYRGSDYYEKNGYEGYINDKNFFSFLFLEESADAYNYSVLPLDELTERYTLMKAQREWFRALCFSPVYRNDYVISEPDADYRKLYATSVKRINEVSHEIKLRMPKPGSFSQKNYELH